MDILNTCEIRRGTVKRCYCRPEYGGPFCREKTKPKIKCAVNYMEPLLAQGCGAKSSDYYNFSLAGHDPCYFVKTNERLNITFRLDCRNVDNITEGVKV